MGLLHLTVNLMSDTSLEITFYFSLSLQSDFFSCFGYVFPRTVIVQNSKPGHKR